MKRILHSLILLTLTATTGLFSSCSMMKEDIEDCPAGLYVRYVYDYNTARADMFKDHVGHIMLYVYDEYGNKVTSRSVSNTGDTGPLAKYGYATHFQDGELKDGKYRLVAIGMQKDWDEALNTPGAKYRRNHDHERVEELHIDLDRGSEKLPDTDLYPVSNEAPLDTMWHTLKVISEAPTDGLEDPGVHATKPPYSVRPFEEQYVEVKEGRATYATISLIRDTKHLNITLRQIDDPDNMFDCNYDAYITVSNRSVGHDNELSSYEHVQYTPYHQWTTRFNEDGTVTIDPTRPEDYKPVMPKAPTGPNDVMRTAHFNMMFNRIIDRPQDPMLKAPVLVIVNRQSGKTVAELNLSSVLAEGRHAYYTYNYSPQEYLDREYDYHLNFLLKGDSWAYCDIVINVLGWSKRVQNVDF